MIDYQTKQLLKKFKEDKGREEFINWQKGKNVWRDDLYDKMREWSNEKISRFPRTLSKAYELFNGIAIANGFLITLHDSGCVSSSADTRLNEYILHLKQEWEEDAYLRGLKDSNK